jgi:hypothetical protein
MNRTAPPQLPRRLAARSAVPLFVAALCATAPALAQPKADRTELEEKRRQQEEKRREIERLKEEATRETADQREARLRAEAKVAAAKQALEKAKEAMQAAGRRQNRRGMELMREAWLLDPANMDYTFNTAAFAEAVGDAEAEFWAYSAFMTTALRELVALGPSTSDYKTLIEDRVTKARGRMDALRPKLSTGMVELEVRPAECELFLDGALVGKGKGSIEALTGLRTVRTDCQGYKPLEQKLNVRGGDANKALLEPPSIDYFGLLIINVKPAEEVTIFLDDQELDKRRGDAATADGVITGAGTKQDPIRLHARKWIIRFAKKGYDRWHRRIEIRRDQITRVDAVLEKMSDTVESSGGQ